MNLFEAVEKYKDESELDSKEKAILDGFVSSEDRKLFVEIGTIDVDKMLAKPSVYSSAVTRYVKNHFVDRDDIVLTLKRFLDNLGTYTTDQTLEANAVKLCQIDKLYDATERSISLLKYLQTGPGSQYEVAEHYCMSTQALNEKLGSLRDGENILGTNIRINELEHGTNRYDSTIHPVFLALNLSEVYFLTVVLKKAFRGQPLQYFAEDVADDVYRQLSGYARNIISERADEAGVYFQKRKNSYREDYSASKEYSGPDERLSRQIVYCEKSQSPCVIEHSDHEQKLVGRITDSHMGTEIVLTEQNGKEHMLSTKGILSISIEPHEISS